MSIDLKRGYYLAVATIVRTHGADTIAEDVPKEWGKIDFRGIDPYDIKVLRPLADSIKRRRAIRPMIRPKVSKIRQHAARYEHRSTRQ